MKKLFTYLIVLLLSLPTLSHTHHKHQYADTLKRCYSSEINNIMLEQNTEARIKHAALEDFTRQFVKQDYKKDGEVYIIPIVFHVVHYYGAENVSYEQILEAVDFLNKDFRKLHADTAQIIPEFKSIAADSRIEFRLARLDPNGDCTIGITRTKSTTTFAGGEDAKIAAPSWPNEMYLNVWVVNSLPHNAAGWAYYPGTAPQGRDGIILLHNYLGSTGTSQQSTARTLTHEVGHYLNLPHPWGNSNEPGLESNCNIDDGVEDTPNTVGWTSCIKYGHSCGSLDNVQNYMEYSYCGRMFTIGQAQRMHASLNFHASGRNNLWTESNLYATGVHDNYEPEICIPESDFLATNLVACTGNSIDFINLSHGTNQIDDYLWEFEGGTPEISQEQNPTIIYNTPGRHKVKLTTENIAGSNTAIREEYVTIFDLNDSYALPYNEIFDSEIFPDIENSGNGFYLINFDSGNWHQTSLASYSGEYSLRIRPRNNDRGSKNHVILPIVKTPQNEQFIEVSLMAAYGRISELSSDRLKFYVSNDCGQSKRIVHVISTNELTSTNTLSFVNYIPDEQDWIEHSFKINTGLLNCDHFRLIITHESGKGNNLYIDDINFSIPLDVKAEKISNKAEIFPNPFSDDLYIDLTGYNEKVLIEIYNSAGKIIYNTQTNKDLLNLSNALSNSAKGLYFIKVSSSNSYEVLRAVKK